MLSDLIAKVASGDLVLPAMTRIMLIVRHGRMIQQMREMVAAILRIDIPSMGSEIVSNTVAGVISSAFS